MKKYICRRCLSYFRSNEDLSSHFEICNNHEPVKAIMPKEDYITKFKNYFKENIHPFVIYIDFESLQEKVKNSDVNISNLNEKSLNYTENVKISETSLNLNENHTENDKTSSISLNTIKINKHIIPYQFTVYLVTRYEENKYFEPICYTLENKYKDNEFTYISQTSFKLITELEKISKYISKIYNSKKSDNLPQNIPVFCHNSTNYDTHLFIKDLCKKYSKIKLIANTDEKYINYTINTGNGYNFNKENKPKKFIHLSFVDTLRFMNSSLEKLAIN